MSRDFVKDADYLDQLPERLASEHPNDVTEAGLAQIEQALAGQRSLRRRASINRSGGDCRRGPRPSLLVRPARNSTRRTGSDRPLGSAVRNISDDRTRRW